MHNLVKKNIEICKMMGVKVTFLDRMWYTWKLQHHVDLHLLFRVIDFIHKIGLHNKILKNDLK